MHRDLRMATSHAAAKERSSRTGWCVENQQWATELLIIGIMQYRTSAGQTIYRLTKSIPADKGKENTREIKHKSYTNIPN